MTARTYYKVSEFGRDAAYVANLILTRHSKPSQKLSVVLFLLKRGHSVHTAQFDSDTLIIDGLRCAWSDLDTRHPVALEKQILENVAAVSHV